MGDAWLLVVIATLTAGGYDQRALGPYDSLAACEEAAEHVRQFQATDTSGHTSAVSAGCVRVMGVAETI
jgi:hypothetical protein